MTLVVGIKYKDGILIGSDSQATLNRGVPLKKLNQIKLFELKYDKGKVVIGGAGAVPFISKSIEEIQSNIKKNKDITFSQITSIAEKAVLHVARWYGFDRISEVIPPLPPMPPIPMRKDLSDSLQKDVDVPKQDVIKHDSSQPQVQIQTVDVILIMAGFDEDNEPQIYIIYPEGISEKQQCEAAIGSGAAYAEYILSQLIFKDMNEEEALKVIIQAINEVRKIDPGVGGMPQVMKINSEGVSPYSDERIVDVVEQVQQIQYHVQGVWHDYLTGKIKFDGDKKDSKTSKKSS